VALVDHGLGVDLGNLRDVAEADPDRRVSLRAGGRARRLHPAVQLAGVDVRGEDLEASPLRLVDERIRRVEAHRLLVEQRTEQLRAIVDPKPGRLVGEQTEGGGVRLGEAEAGEALDLAEDLLRHLARDPAPDRAVDEPLAIALHRRL